MSDDQAATRADLLAIVERSPAAAGAHDRAGWVGLFAAGGTVEDPVGSRPHCGTAELTRFYDTFIGPRDITFHRDLDVVAGTAVIRDLELEVAMSPAVVMRIPAFLRYDVDPDAQAITRLRAHWELPAMVAQFARSGLAAAPVGIALTRGLLSNQGIAGTVGFASGFAGVGRRGKRHLTDLLHAAAVGDEVAVRRAVADSAHVTLGDDVRLSSSEFTTRLAGARWHKVIAAGDTVAASVDAGGTRGVVIAEFRRRAATLARLRLFTEGGARENV
jgi:hypothetical protein